MCSTFSEDDWVPLSQDEIFFPEQSHGYQSYLEARRQIRPIHTHLLQPVTTGFQPRLPFQSVSRSMDMTDVPSTVELYNINTHAFESPESCFTGFPAEQGVFHGSLCAAGRPQNCVEHQPNFNLVEVAMENNGGNFPRQLSGVAGQFRREKWTGVSDTGVFHGETNDVIQASQMASPVYNPLNMTYSPLYNVKGQRSEWPPEVPPYKPVDNSNERVYGVVSNCKFRSRPGLVTKSSHTTCSNRLNLCRICGRSYARPSTLKTHLRTHSGERPFKCTLCGKSFSQAANLTAHLRTHSGEKPFHCPVCQRRFSQSSSVTTHMRTHSGERPYICRLCKKSFSDSSTLTKHVRIHSGEKPYQCKSCLLRFSQSGNLNRHMKIHSINNGDKNDAVCSMKGP